MAAEQIALLVIDPQNDFCDIPLEHCPMDTLALHPERIKPALPVPGAHVDMLRLSSFIDRMGARLSSIHVTLDSHGPVDIAHPSWWRHFAGGMPAPFSVISVEDVHAGRWQAADPKWQEYSERYVRMLADGGRYPLVVWPEHCLVGGWGHNVHSAVQTSLNQWARQNLRGVDYVVKGLNPTTEHYSAFRAEVPDPADQATWLNTDLIWQLKRADQIVIPGEALSHCVANSVRDLADNIGESNISKLVLLTDCTSSVTGFEKQGDDFVREMLGRGMRLAISSEFLA